MIRTIIALNDDALAQSMTQALIHRGITVRYRCQTGAEVIRAVKEMGGGVIICSFKLRDMTVGEMADRLEGQALILVLAKGNTLALCDRDDLFTLSVPVRPSENLSVLSTCSCKWMPCALRKAFQNAAAAIVKSLTKPKPC